MNSRRAFLKSSAGLAAALAARPLGGTPQPAVASLPQIRLGNYEVSRLVMGCDQFYGASHFNDLLDVEQVVKRIRPIAMYHWGEAVDVFFREGKMDRVQEYTKRLRQTGVLVGLGTHKPEVVEYAEERGWDVDFYLLCAYNRTRTPEEIRKMLGVLPLPASDVYLETDPPRAYRVAKQTKKSCFLFKILAAGRVNSPEDIDNAFKTVFASIKPNDGVIVGMYPRYRDEVKQNADRVRRILNVGS